MLTIITNETRRSAGLLVVSGRRVLLLKRSRQSNNPLKWGLPGGRLGRRETPYEAALREAHEEVGPLPDLLPFGSLAVQRGARRYEIFACHAARDTRSTWRPRLDHEHEAFRWAKLRWMLRHQDRLHPVLRATIEDPRGLTWLRRALRDRLLGASPAPLADIRVA